MLQRVVPRSRALSESAPESPRGLRARSGALPGERHGDNVTAPRPVACVPGGPLLLTVPEHSWALEPYLRCSLCRGWEGRPGPRGRRALPGLPRDFRTGTPLTSAAVRSHVRARVPSPGGPRDPTGSPLAPSTPQAHGASNPHSEDGFKIGTGCVPQTWLQGRRLLSGHCALPELSFSLRLSLSTSTGQNRRGTSWHRWPGPPGDRLAQFHMGGQVVPHKIRQTRLAFLFSFQHLYILRRTWPCQTCGFPSPGVGPVSSQSWDLHFPSL